MKKYFLLLSLTSTIAVNAQDIIQPSQFWNNYSFYNPALNIDGSRQQASVTYKNLRINPSIGINNLIANYNFAINKHHAIGVNYSTTFFNRTNVSYSFNVADINYSYRIQFKDSTNHWLSFGIGAGLTNSKLAFDNEQPTDPNSGNTFKETIPGLNLGMAYRYKNFMIGTGIRNITDFGATNSSFLSNRLSMHLMSSYDFRVTENFHLKPQLFVSNGFGGNLLATFYKNYSVGIGYGNNVRSGFRNRLSFNAQIDIAQKFRIGYSFDFTPKIYSVGAPTFSHEFVLGFRLK